MVVLTCDGLISVKQVFSLLWLGRQSFLLFGSICEELVSCRTPHKVFHLPSRRVFALSSASLNLDILQNLLWFSRWFLKMNFREILTIKSLISVLNSFKTCFHAPVCGGGVGRPNNENNPSGTSKCFLPSYLLIIIQAILCRLFRNSRSFPTSGLIYVDHK